jgi:hypothetical protein
MIRSVAMHRRFGQWLIGLYVLAIAGGFMPLVASYSGHGVGSAVAEVTRGAGAHDHHHLGDADDAAHHHVLQDLTGALAWPPGQAAAHVVHVAMMPVAPPPLIEADAVRLERPPKPFLSI